MLLTTKYKRGYIHTSTYEEFSKVRVQVDQYAYAIVVKSVHAAKIMITKHEKRVTA